MSKLDMEQGELSPLDVPPPTPLTRGYLPLQDLGFLEEQKDEVLDLTKLTFDQVNLKTML